MIISQTYGAQIPRREPLDRGPDRGLIRLSLTGAAGVTITFADGGSEVYTFSPMMSNLGVKAKDGSLKVGSGKVEPMAPGQGCAAA